MKSTEPERADRSLTGQEARFGDDEVIVSKTDPKGRITYANEVFLRISGYTEAEVLGAPHSILRHPAMPRCVFKLLWDTISTGNEIFAYVINRCKNGDHYWVLAHVTPTFDSDGRIVNYHSNRRSPSRAVIPAIEELYARLLAVENSVSDRNSAMTASTAVLVQLLEDAGMQYDEWVFSLSMGPSLSPLRALPRAAVEARIVRSAA